MSTTPFEPVGRLSDDCGCCEGLGPETPAPVENRPGLPAISYRVGTHAQFKSTMLAALSSAGRPPLTDLNTRSDDDFTVALVDAWATVGDILTFYGERAANEAFLRTATERTSLLELARLIGYELRPGVAAAAYLAFELEEAEEAPREVTIAIGTRVQSVPGQDEEPQTFETVEELAARPEWNTIRPRLLQSQGLGTAQKSVVLDGLGMRVSPGDELLLVDRPGAPRRLRTALKVVEDQAMRTTRIDFVRGSLPKHRFRTPKFPPGKFPAGPEPLTGELVRELVLGHTWSSADLVTLAQGQGWSLEELTETVTEELARPPDPSQSGLFAFRTRASVFGHNAPLWKSLPAVLRFGELVTDSTGGPKTVEPAYPESWEGRTLANAETGGTPYLHLDSTYPKIVPGGWLALESPAKKTSHRILGNLETSLSRFTINAKATRLLLDHDRGFGTLTIRGTTVLGESERLPLARIPIPNAVRGDRIPLNGFYLGLDTGRKLVLTGEPEELPGVVVHEIVTVESSTVDGGYTVLRLTTSLAHSYRRETVTLNANLALGTHGESKQEVLGSGDAGRPYQRFPLKQKPLTHVGAATTTGAESTLRVYVNGIQWHEVSSLFGRGPNERVYITRLDAVGGTTVEFGDGSTGARLPSGAENVEALYRKGIGLSGLVGPAQLTLLLTRPLGVRGVTNPIGAEGAQDAEAESEARTNAPLTVLTLERIVSLQDYEDFTRAYAGIAKALATWRHDRRARTILITLAGPKGAQIRPGPLQDNLSAAIRAQSDTGIRFALTSYRPVLFQIRARLKLDPDHLPDRVLAAAEQMMRDRFSFDARAFGQPVAKSEIEAALQEVDGVVAVDLDALHRSEEPVTLEPVLWAAVPSAADVALLGAELLMLDPRPLDLTTMP